MTSAADPTSMSDPRASGGAGAVTIGVSIPIPEPQGPDLQARRTSYGDPLGRSVPAHITLVGPTSVDRDQFVAFEAHCAEVAAHHAPFTVVLRGAGTFRPISDVVFVQVASGVADCERLEMSLRAGPVRRDLDFYYHPHVTVAHNVPTDQLDRAFEDLADYAMDFTVDAFHLYVQGEGGVWRPVRSFDLKGTP